MSKMFDNYNNETNINIPPLNASNSLLKPIQSSPNLALLYNLKGELYGIEARHNMPFVLYFHLDEMSGQNLNDFVAKSLVEFKLITQNHKIAFEKVFNGAEIFTSGSDLVISINQEEAQSLKQESYWIDLCLRQPVGFYRLFSNKDGLLVIR